MNYKILVAMIFLIGFTTSIQAQTLITTGEVLTKKLEEKAIQQRAAEKANPSLSKNRSGRIATKEEKIENQIARQAKNKKMAKAFKTMKGKKIKISKPKPPKPTRGTTKKIKTKEE